MNKSNLKNYDRLYHQTEVSEGESYLNKGKKIEIYNPITTANWAFYQLAEYG